MRPADNARSESAGNSMCSVSRRSTGNCPPSPSTRTRTASGKFMVHIPLIAVLSATLTLYAHDRRITRPDRVGIVTDVRTAI